MKILLDTNFILTCVKQKINFQEMINQITSQSIEWLVPQDVLDELGTFQDRKGAKVPDKSAAKLSFEILQNLKTKTINLPGKNPNVDIKIVNYILDKPIILATLDKNLKSRVKNKILTIRGKKNLEFV
jgi:rRNA-processing protein FCF1